MRKYLLVTLSVLAVFSLGLVLAHCGGGGSKYECTKNSDCNTAAGEYCDLTVHKCKTQGGCTSGQTKCNGNVIQTCSNNTWVNGTDCAATGQTCQSGACVGGSCTNGQVQCSGNWVQTCTNSTWTNTTDCAAQGKTCQSGQCVASGCTNGTTQCNGTVVQTCQNNQWVNGTDCSTTGKICQDGQCVAAGCTNGTTQCSGNWVQTCTNNTWTNTTDCAATGKVCNAGQCVTSGCTNGTTQCSGNIVQTCTNNQWVNGTDCAAQGKVCLNGVCTGGTTSGCPAGQTCADISGGEGFLACSVDGQLPSNAQTGCSDTVACTITNSSCLCTDQNCTATVCAQNCGPCPQDQICVDLSGDGKMGCLTTSETIPTTAPRGCGGGTGCTGNATCWCLDSTCTTNSVCLNNCDSHGPCTAGATGWCNGTVPMTCSGGQWVAGADCAATGKSCDQGACVDAIAAGMFCNASTPCPSTSLECVGMSGRTNGMCTPVCDCTSGSGCNTTPTSECFWGNANPPTKCWCGWPCTTAADCPGGATGWECYGTTDKGCIPL